MIPRHKYDICTLLLKGGNGRCYNKEACGKRCKQQNIKSITSSSSFLVDTSDDDRRVEEKKIWDDRKARSAEKKKRRKSRE